MAVFGGQHADIEITEASGRALAELFAAGEFLRAAARIAPVLMSWGQLGGLCRRKAHGGSFNTAREQLIELGYVLEARKLIEIQPTGFEYLGEKPAAVNRRDVVPPLPYVVSGHQRTDRRRNLAPIYTSKSKGGFPAPDNGLEKQPGALNLRYTEARNPVAALRRTLDKLEATRDGDDIFIAVSACSFLHRQVRSMAGSLKLVGEGKWQADGLRRTHGNSKT